MATPQNYTVQSGDTLNAIAQKYGYSNYKKAGISGYGDNPDFITPGTVLSFNPPTTQSPAVYTSTPASNAVGNVQNTVANYQAPKTTKDKVAAIDADRQSAYDEYKAQIDSINNGNLTPEQTMMLESTKAALDSTRRAQELANKNYTAGMTILGIRQGRNRYAAEIEQGNIKASIDQGIAKLNDLDAKSQMAIYQMRQSMVESDYKRALETYSVYNDLLKEKSDTIFKLNQDARADQQLNMDWYNSTHTANQKDYAYYLERGGKKSFYDWTNAKTGSSDAPSVITADIASQLGLPDSLVGLTKEEFTSGLESGTPPDWFRPYIEGELSQSLTDEGLQWQWDSFKNSDNAKEIMAMNSSSTDSGGNSDVDIDALLNSIQ